MSELLGVVDLNDKVINILPRTQIHARGLPHRAVHILIFNQQEELFLQKRSKTKDLNKGLWDTSAAGHVDPGESYLESAIRETREELGICVQDKLQPLFKMSPIPQLGMEFIQVYQCINNGPFTLNPEEIEQGDWFSKETISQRVQAKDPTLTETFKAIWQSLTSE